ncbi:recombinase family protein [Nocardia sp. NPDC049190]|uniref:recombinase family protein n=1 Tax=Nocardia sp. NPDC049190 TaxID=3155650 RepID=UPI0033D6141F
MGGLVRVTTSKQETRRQHDDLDPICVKVFEEKISGKLEVVDRPGLQTALDYMRPADLLTVQEADETVARTMDADAANVPALRAAFSDLSGGISTTATSSPYIVGRDPIDASEPARSRSPRVCPAE